MSTAQQVLIFDPPKDLVFRGQLGDEMTCLLNIHNPSFARVSFKVKTTAPKQYRVLPVTGVIEPGNTFSVAVIMQPLQSFSNADRELMKHKFLVQSTFYTPGVALGAIWRNAAPSELMQTKLRVVFEGTGGAYKTNASSLCSTPAELSQPATPENNLTAKLKTTAANTLTVSQGVSQSTSETIQSGTGIKLLTATIVALIALFVGLAIGKLF